MKGIAALTALAGALEDSLEFITPSNSKAVCTVLLQRVLGSLLLFAVIGVVQLQVLLQLLHSELSRPPH